MSFIPVWIIAAALTSAPMANGIDPLTATVDDAAAQRFAQLWRSTDGKPTAQQIQTQYLDRGGRGIEVFTPHRIVNADNLMAKLTDDPEIYRDAVERCLPWVASTNAELRAAYLGLKGLFPDRPLPQIAVVIGANNSGGTADTGIQVIGLEVICRLSASRQAFDALMRQFFTHETVHTFQQPPSTAARKDPLFAEALAEGVPDYVSAIVTAQIPNSTRDEWARGREAWIWEQFQRDAVTVREGTDDSGNMTLKARAAFSRWFANAGSPPPGWPGELGYWVGMRIAERFVEGSHDPHAAIEELLNPHDPAKIVAASGYGSHLAH